MSILPLPNLRWENKPFPPELPEDPEGWKRRQTLHMRLQGGGTAVYTVFDPSGREMPFAFCYDSRPPGTRGFTLPDVARVMTWAQLREEWPKWLERTDTTAKQAALEAANNEVKR